MLSTIISMSLALLPFRYFSFAKFTSFEKWSVKKEMVIYE